ncbi:MAG TPA: hypothetical protein VMQ99_09000 [Acetobacteraceae bacterium]|nr:hypothetical protein [Acetobacteraceae bacterium]
MDQRTNIAAAVLIIASRISRVSAIIATKVPHAMIAGMTRIQYP